MLVIPHKRTNVETHMQAEYKAGAKLGRAPPFKICVILGLRLCCLRLKKVIMC